MSFDATCSQNCGIKGQLVTVLEFHDSLFMQFLCLLPQFSVQLLYESRVGFIWKVVAALRLSSGPAPLNSAVVYSGGS